MYTPDMAQRICQRFPEASLAETPDKFVRDPAVQVIVPSRKLRDVATFAKTDASLSMDMPNHMTAVDHIKEGVFELVYFLYSTRHKQGLVLKSRIPRKDAVIDTVSDIWEGMDWQEREVYDLMGITFRHHPNMKRIMMWEGFPGHPLRKDYVHVTDHYDSGLEVGTPGLDEKGIPLKKP